MSGKELIKNEEIQSRIFSVRGLQVMIDSDLAELYRIEVKLLNRAVKRNIERFPPEFMFQLTTDENNSLRSQFVTLENQNCLRFQIGTSNNKQNLRSQIVTSNQRGGRRYLSRIWYRRMRYHKTVYHFGASLKDLGKKWFAFSKMDIGAVEMLRKLEKMG